MFRISQDQAERALLAQVSSKTPFPPSLLEKDYVLTDVLGLISSLAPKSGSIQFGGGTSLVKAWRLPARLSEDLDLKYVPDSDLSRRKQNEAFREFRLDLRRELLASGLDLVLETGGVAPSEFFSFHFAYSSQFGSRSSVDPIVRVECRREYLILDPQIRNIHSLADQALGYEENFVSIACTRPEEIAAQKLWIVLGDLDRFEANPRDFRHLFDLWQLKGLGLNVSLFTECFDEVCGRRGLRVFSSAFWQTAQSKSVAEAFGFEVEGLTPLLVEYKTVQEALRYFEALVSN